MKSVMAAFLAIIVATNMLVGVAFACPGPKGDGKVHVGVLLPETSSVPELGEPVLAGVNLAIAELKPKIGDRIEFHVATNSDDPVQDARDLIQKENVSAIIGSVFSSNSIPIAEVAQANGVVMISPTATAPDLTIGRDHVFRAAVLDAVEATEMANYAASDLRARTAAVIYDGTGMGPVGSWQAQSFREEFVRNGGRITAFEPIVYDANGSPNPSAIASIVSQMGSQRPDVIYMPSLSAAPNSIIPQLRANGISAPVLGTSAWDPLTGTTLDLANFKGSLYTSHFSATDPHHEAREFTRAYTQARGVSPNALAALGYDATQILVEAIVKAKFGDASEIQRAMADTKNYKGASGVIRQFVGGNPEKSLVLLEVSGGRVIYKDTLRP